MPCQITGADGHPPTRPTMAIRLNGVALDIGEPVANWPGALREVAKAMACAAVEGALDFGERNSATIEVWDADGRLLVAVLASVQACWPGQDVRRDGWQGPAKAWA